MRRMIPQKLIDAIKKLAPLAGLLVYDKEDDVINSAKQIIIGDVNVQYAYIDDGEIGVGDEYGETIISPRGISKVMPEALAHLTHSFDELDPTLKKIVDDAIQDGETNGVACTTTQWNKINELLDTSLYIEYNGNSMIKSLVSLNDFTFGIYNNEIGNLLRIHYDFVEHLLYAKHSEV